MVKSSVPPGGIPQSGKPPAPYPSSAGIMSCRWWRVKMRVRVRVRVGVMMRVRVRVRVRMSVRMRVRVWVDWG